MKKNSIFTIIKTKFRKNFNQTRKRKEWTKQEDDIILQLSKRLPRKDKWIFISKLIKTRSPLECYRRLKSIDPKYKKGRWTQSEDLLLLRLVNHFGRSWNMISKIFKNRSNKQVKIRYDEYIDPKISSEKFTSAEDDLIIKLYPVYLNKWSKYQVHLPNRSQKRIKLRFNFLSAKNSFYNAGISDNSSFSTSENNSEKDKSEDNHNNDSSEKFFSF